ncbi:MAG: sle [Blastococcus sp.]|jgi:hypothetical protein|nr:sle [Blastococcus sp.]
MRMMLKVLIDTEAGNEAFLKGQLQGITKQIASQLNPEAAYFLPEGGRRSCLFVFDMTDASQIPAIVEPLFLGAKAQVTLTPCMNVDDLEKGLAQALPESGQSNL